MPLTLHYTSSKKQLHSRTNGKVYATQQLVGALVFAKTGVRAKCDELSNWFRTTPLKFDRKPSRAAFSAVFQNLRNAGDVAGNVISDVAVDKVGVDVRIKFGDTM